MKNFIEIHLKLVITIWLILFSVLGLLLLMNYMKFSSMMSGVVSSQLQVISSSMQRSIIKAEQLGLPLAEMQNLPALLQRESSRDEQIKSIVIIDHTGRLLFHSDVAAAQLTALNADILRRANKSTDVQWSVESDLLLYSGLQLYDATEQLMGNIIIIYNKSNYLTAISKVLYQLLTVSAAIFGLFALFVFLAVRWGFADINNVLKIIHSQLQTDTLEPAIRHFEADTLAYKFFEKIERREKMKQHVADQLSACSSNVTYGNSDQRSHSK